MGDSAIRLTGRSKSPETAAGLRSVLSSQKEAPVGVSFGGHTFRCVSRETKQDKPTSWAPQTNSIFLSLHEPKEVLRPLLRGDQEVPFTLLAAPNFQVSRRLPSSPVVSRRLPSSLVVSRRLKITPGHP